MLAWNVRFSLSLFTELPLSKPEQFIEVASPFLSYRVESSAGRIPELCVNRNDLILRNYTSWVFSLLLLFGSFDCTVLINKATTNLHSDLSVEEGKQVNSFLLGVIKVHYHDHIKLFPHLLIVPPLFPPFLRTQGNDSQVAVGILTIWPFSLFHFCAARPMCYKDLYCCTRLPTQSKKS